MLQLLAIDPNTAFTSFMWLLLSAGLSIMCWFIRGHNKEAKAKRIIRRNDLWERGH